MDQSDKRGIARALSRVGASSPAAESAGGSRAKLSKLATVWQTARLFGACALAYGLALAAGLAEGYWAVITAVVVTQPMLSDTLSAGRDRILGTLIGAAAGFIVLEAADNGMPLMPLFWLTLFALSVLVALFPYLRLCAVTLVVVVLVPGNGKSAFVRPADRVLEILIGTLAAILLAALMRPKLWRRLAAALMPVRDEAGGPR